MIYYPLSVLIFVGIKRYLLSQDLQRFEEFLGEDRAEHDRLYTIDATKLENELELKADENFDSVIVKITEWYLRKNL